MAFKFESNEFKSIFNQLNNIARDIIKSENYSENLVSLASHFLTSSQIFNTNVDLSEFDKNIQYSTNQPVSDFVKVLEIELEKYKGSKHIYELEYLFDLSLNLINIYFSELTFKLGAINTSISLEVASFTTFVSERYASHPKFSRYVKFAERDLPFQIFKELFHSSEIKNLSELNANVNRAATIIHDWENNFKTKHQNILELEDKLDRTKMTYDFLGLNKGFQQLYDQKKDELSKAKDTYSLVAASMFMIPFIEFVFLVGLLFYFKGSLPSNIWWLSIPFITMLIVLFYLVRIHLQDKRTIQSQMMQLELRMALCQFIQSYAEDSEKLHRKNEKGFEKFENIIFSPLVSSDDKIPTTFDSVEQLAKLIQILKK